MARFALIIAMAASASRFLYPKLCEVLGAEPVRFLDLLPFVPAILLGAGSLRRVNCFAKSAPVALCAAIVVAALFYAEEIKSNRGLLIAFYWLSALPISALIVENRCWRLCAKVYVFTSAAVLLLVFWFDYFAHGGIADCSTLRLGFLWNAGGGEHLSDPNRLGAQLALASVVAFVLYATPARRSIRPRDSARSAQGISLGWTLLLSVGCLATASRGAFVAWFGGMALLLVWVTRMREANKLRDIAAVAAILPVMLLAGAVATGVAPWEKLHDRLTQIDRVAALGGRTEIWSNAARAWCSSPRYMIVGAGPGVADELLGRFDDRASRDRHGSFFRDVHSSFAEWSLSFGLLGMTAGAWMLWRAFGGARRLDRKDGSVARRAILLCVCLFAMTGIVHRWPGWLAAVSLILAMLSEAPAARPAAVAADAAELNLLPASNGLERMHLPRETGKHTASVS